jgi:hypothetical protein
LSATAEAEAVIADENEARGKADPSDDITRVTERGTSAAYLLRRLAREAPDILAAYERQIIARNPDKSNREIAKIAKVDHKTIGLP